MMTFFFFYSNKSAFVQIKNIIFKSTFTGNGFVQTL